MRADFCYWCSVHRQCLRPPTLSNKLKVKAGPTAMQKVLKQNLHKIVIYVNKPRPAARDRSQSTTSEGCKNF